MKLLIKGVELNGVATDIYIENKYIKQIGPGLSVAADKVIDGSRKAAIPGFVNTHTHAAMTLFRGFGDDMPLMPWLEEKIWPNEAKLTKEDVFWGAKLACLEISGKQDDTQRRRDGSRIGLAGDPKTLYCTHPARTVLAGTGVARHSWYCLLVFRHTETKDPQAQPDMPEMQSGNPPGDSFARVDKGYEPAD